MWNEVGFRAEPFLLTLGSGMVGGSGARPTGFESCLAAPPWLCDLGQATPLCMFPELLKMGMLVDPPSQACYDS